MTMKDEAVFISLVMGGCYLNVWSAQHSVVRGERTGRKEQTDTNDPNLVNGFKLKVK